jgi:hypothetical protein
MAETNAIMGCIINRTADIVPINYVFPPDPAARTGARPSQPFATLQKILRLRPSL